MAGQADQARYPPKCMGQAKAVCLHGDKNKHKGRGKNKHKADCMLAHALAMSCLDDMHGDALMPGCGWVAALSPTLRLEPAYIPGHG